MDDFRKAAHAEAGNRQIVVSDFNGTLEIGWTPNTRLAAVLIECLEAGDRIIVATSGGYTPDVMKAVIEPAFTQAQLEQIEFLDKAQVNKAVGQGVVCVVFDNGDQKEVDGYLNRYHCRAQILAGVDEFISLGPKNQPSHLKSYEDAAALLRLHRNFPRSEAVVSSSPTPPPYH